MPEISSFPETTRSILSSGLLRTTASTGQQRIWFNQQEKRDSLPSPHVTCNIVLPLTIQHGCLSIDHMRRILHAILDRYTILRTAVYYNEKIGQLEQEIMPTSDDRYSFKVTQNIQSIEQIEALITLEVTNNFAELRHGLVVHCHIVHMGDDNEDICVGDVIVFAFHQIAFDYNSFEPFINALNQECNSSVSRHVQRNIPQYIDYSMHEQNLMTDRCLDSKMNLSRKFWSKIMSDWSCNKTPVALPKISQTSTKRSYSSQSFAFQLDQNFFNAQTHFAISNNASIYHISMAYYFAFLFKLGLEEDLCVVSPTAHRHLPEMKSMIGMFVNLIPYRIKVEPEKSFLNLVQQIEHFYSVACEHSLLPYEEIANSSLNNQNRSSTIPLFFYSKSTELPMTRIQNCDKIIDHLTTFNKWNDQELLQAIVIKPNHLSLIVSHDHYAHKTRCVFECSTDLLDQAALELFAKRFETMLKQIFSVSSISQLSLLLPEECSMLHQLNSTDDFSLTDNTIHYKIVERAYDQPQKISLILDAQCLSYAELLHASQYLAHHLIDVYHVKRHDIVTQCVNRSIEMIIGIMAIVMTGATYCPLSPDQPVKRLHSLIAQTQSVCTLIHSATKPFELSNYVEIDKVLLSSGQKQVSIEHIACADDIAYAIFTSGSTGTPKCVPITHQNLNTCLGALKFCNIMTQNDIVLQICSVTFDIHLEEILGTLWLGGQLVLLRHSTYLDMDYVTLVINNSQVTFMSGVSTLFATLVQHLEERENPFLPTLKCLCFGGKFRKMSLLSSMHLLEHRRTSCN